MSELTMPSTVLVFLMFILTARAVAVLFSSRRALFLVSTDGNLSNYLLLFVMYY